jgi:hypothetical protein
VIASSRVVSAVGAAICLLLASGCGQPSRGDLHGAAKSLIPPGAIVLLKRDGECVEGASFPSCTEVYFRLARRPLFERLNLFITNAKQHGWKAERSGAGGGEVFVKISKGSYRGGAGLWLDRYYRPYRPHCNPVSTLHPCADSFQVQWKGGKIGG